MYTENNCHTHNLIPSSWLRRLRKYDNKRLRYRNDSLIKRYVVGMVTLDMYIELFTYCKILKYCLITHLFFLLQVMETKNMIYIVSEYASKGEIFGKLFFYDDVSRCLWRHFSLINMYLRIINWFYVLNNLLDNNTKWTLLTSAIFFE